MTDTLDEVLKQVHAIEAEKNAPPMLTVLEPDERPVPVQAETPLYKRLNKTDCLEYAVELAADMMTGYYQPEGASEPWPKGRFIIKEILRRMGYAPSTVDQNHRPTWWPEGGTTAFKGFVDWKVRERAVLGKVTYDKLTPYLEALTVKGFAEMSRRLLLHPEDVPFRDLSQFVMRGMDAIKAQSDPLTGQMSHDGADAYERVHRAISGVGDETARKAIEALLDATLVAARDRMRKVVEVPARTA